MHLQVSDPNDGDVEEMYPMSSVTTDKSTLTSYNSLYSNWSPYVSPSEFSTTAPLQLPPQPPLPPPYSPSIFPKRKLMLKHPVPYKIPHAKLDSEC